MNDVPALFNKLPNERVESLHVKNIKTTIVIFSLFTVLTGLIYPLVITGIAQVLFPHQANGSLIKAHDGSILGSKLIGQSFDDPKYFWGRLSATAGNPYNAAASGGSKLSVSNQALMDQVQARIDALHAADPGNTFSIPVDLVQLRPVVWTRILVSHLPIIKQPEWQEYAILQLKRLYR